MRKLLVLVLAVALIAALGILIERRSRTPVEHVAPVGPPVIFALGRVEGATPEIELRPRLPGRIEQLLATEGRFVEAGTVLLRLDAEQYRDEVALAAANLNLADAQLDRLQNGAHAEERKEAAALYEAKRAELERAQLVWDRARRLLAARAISQQEADNQRTQVDSLIAEVAAARARHKLMVAPAREDEVLMAKARIAAAKANLELAKMNLERTELKAPCRGQILKVDVEIGELTGPDSQKPAVIMADTTQYHVRAFIEEMDAPRVEVGMIADILADGLPGEKLKGRVVRLSPRMGPKQLWSDRPTERYDTKTREVWIKLEERKTLVVGLRVDVMIDPDSQATADPHGKHDNTSADKSTPLHPLRSTKRDPKQRAREIQR